MKKSKLGEGCIYLLTNLKNGKRNVGLDSSGDPENHRWKNHITAALTGKSKYPLHRAIRKAYRESKGKTLGFSAEIIWRGLVEKLNEKEIYYIKKLHSYMYDPKGASSYNLTTGGEGFHGRFSKKAKKNMSEAHLRSYAEHPEYREQNRVAQLRSYAENPIRRENQSTGQLRRYKRLVEHKNMRLAQLLRYESPAEHEKTRAALMRPEIRKKMSIAQVRSYKEKPERCTKISTSGRMRLAAMTKEERSNIARKGWVTRRKHKEL